MKREHINDAKAEHAADAAENSEFYDDFNRLLPPVDLTVEQQQLFTDIVNTKPPAYFNRADIYTLSELVKHITKSRFLARQIEQAEQQFNVRDYKTVEVYNKLLASSERESRAINANMRSLRLTIQSRYDAKVANTLSSQTDGQFDNDPSNFE